jgi:hypothetical protein
MSARNGDLQLEWNDGIEIASGTYVPERTQAYGKSGIVVSKRI